uniref:Uncharacterized protein n=1 Tax=Chromera velia CCMP2878 TaxID=1169474 RepID=A0A0G4HRY4_9ALVE|eukprot:Cvel_8192.t1-p1 / transcript=Cvel_8192.t1 / gene=Cvel_8192 / organism=Chromera_velia_CCMP2878 / gene_product=hypothetical protein / transcript_product=hypothetical protein / location=Cvel_scaffold446:69634-72646(-) / protein_length=201 / sequence_SO=supercontig / SO=protein_coding / is_pseudo=false
MLEARGIQGACKWRRSPDKVKDHEKWREVEDIVESSMYAKQTPVLLKGLPVAYSPSVLPPDVGGRHFSKNFPLGRGSKKHKGKEFKCRLRLLSSQARRGWGGGPLQQQQGQGGLRPFAGLSKQQQSGGGVVEGGQTGSLRVRQPGKSHYAMSIDSASSGEALNEERLRRFNGISPTRERGGLKAIGGPGEGNGGARPPQQQ